MKPHLACDYDVKKLRFPIAMLPKIDGVRGLNVYGQFFARSMKRHANKYTAHYYSRDAYSGLDGELAAEHECHPDLCRITTSATSTVGGTPFTLWHVFDHTFGDGDDRPFTERHAHAEGLVKALRAEDQNCRLRIVPYVIVNNLQELQEKHDEWVAMGYEGSILRDPNGKYKLGRATVREGAYMRIKDFIDAEAVIVAIVEGEENQNEAQINELGKTFRTSHKENKVPNGMVGSFLGEMLADVLDPVSGKVLLTKGQQVTISPGSLTHDERKAMFQDQSLALGKISKFKFFPKGIKDKPRFPIHQSFRAPEDM